LKELTSNPNQTKFITMSKAAAATNYTEIAQCPVRREKQSDNRVSVYIPRIHNKFNNAAVHHVFGELFGIVQRIDNVSVKTPDGTDTQFHSAFVYYDPYPRNDLIQRIAEENSVRINPNLNTTYMRKHYNQPNPKVRNSEFWMLLPNNSKVPDTDMPLDQIHAKLVELEPRVVGNEEETASLNAYRQFYEEIEAKQRGAIPLYQDTKINVHQLVQNIKLMEQRLDTPKEAEQQNE
jgi:hypothetical protein